MDHQHDHPHDPREGAVEVRAASPDDWQVVRHLRLSALADTPDAFGSTLELESVQPESFWRDRLTRPDATTLVAHVTGQDGDARATGLTTVAASFDGQPDTAGIYAVWVAPSARGRGVGDALIAAAIAHARAAGFVRAVLDVGDHNEPAQRLYARHGFAPTGRTSTLPEPRTHLTEHELARPLSSPADR